MKFYFLSLNDYFYILEYSYTSSKHFECKNKPFFMDSFTLLPSKVKIWKCPSYFSGFFMTVEWHLWKRDAEGGAQTVLW